LGKKEECGGQPATFLRPTLSALRGQAPDDYMAEPYIMPGNVDGPLSELPGQGGWTWYTGSAGWYLRATVEGVLGTTADLAGLRVSADLPHDWPGFRLRRQFRGAIYDIIVRRGAVGEARGCRVDGQPWPAEVLPVAEPGTVQTVEVVV
jgi:cellobiose phosphorylase